MSSYLRGLEDCGWLKHIKSVMDTSIFIAKVSWLIHNCFIIVSHEVYERSWEFGAVRNLERSLKMVINIIFKIL